MPIRHFSAWDLNWGLSPPEDAEPPRVPEPSTDDSPDDPCQEAGSVIGCESQTLGEVVPVTGTPLSLHYSSERTPGRRSKYRLNVPLSGSRLPSSVTRIDLTISVAGQILLLSFPPAPNQSYDFEWDGKDAFGRIVQGEQTVTTRIEYAYRPVYQRVARFGYSGNGLAIFGTRARDELRIAQTWRGRLGTWDARAAGLGGWTLDIHHAYVPAFGVLHQGDGTRRSSAALGASVMTTAGTGTMGSTGDGGPATEARVGWVRGLDTAADGSLYLADTTSNRIRRIDADGVITTVAGGGSSLGDGGKATEARLTTPHGVAVAPDGTLYIADSGQNRLRRVDTEGIITTVAGTGALASTGDGGPAVEAALHEPWGVVLSPDGSIYVTTPAVGRVRRIGPDGIIDAFAGGGPTFGDGGPATRAQVDPQGLAVGPDGVLYLTDTRRNRVRRVGLDGTITTLAGSELPCNALGGCGDGGPATDARLNHPHDVDVAADGTIYIADSHTHRIRRVGSDGIITTLAGTGLGSYGGDGGPATAAHMNQAFSVAVAPDGSVYFGDTGNNRVRRVVGALPGLSLEETVIAAEDAGELYVFDRAGRHRQTVDALTGALRHRFVYDDAGRVLGIDDGDGNHTQVERDASGAPTAIVVPGGQRTKLTVDSAGYLSSVANPAGEATRLTYAGRGLLSVFTDPRNGVHGFTYDDAGRLIKDEDPAEGSKTLTRSEIENGYSVAVRTALDRTTIYALERLPTGEVRRTVTSPSGARTETLFGTDRSRSTTRPDGTQLSEQSGPDPRFGMQSPVLTREVLTTPGGLRRTTTGESVASFDSTGELTELTDRTTTNGRIATRLYDSAARSLTTTSPAGRTTRTTLDEKGRPARFEPAPGVTPVIYTYDARGRLAMNEQGSHSLTYAYDDENRMASVTDAAGRVARYGYDSAGRVDELKMPSGRTYRFAYDAHGNRTEVRKPSGAVHRTAHTALDDRRSYTPPGGESVTQSYDADQAPARTSLPSGRVIDTGYDGGGRAKGATYDEATVAVDYADATERPQTIARSASAGGQTQETSYSYDGELLTGSDTSGVATARFQHTYDNNLARTSTRLTSGSQSSVIALERDLDGLLTKVGPFTVARAGPAGAPSEITDGTLTTSLTYNGLARLTRRSHAVAGALTYRLDLAHDAVGRVIEKTETVGAGTHVYTYGYDDDGQLEVVTRDGVPVERYTYDDNGNRTSRRRGTDPDESAGYDAQDRLERRGQVDYEFDADGFLTKRGPDSLRYSATGELLEADVGGQAVAYAYDGRGRRVSRTIAGSRTEYLYGNPQSPFEVSAVRSPDGTLTVLHYDVQGLLHALERSGTRYYVATDQVGTPKLVTDGLGTVVKAREYDTFGNLVSDSDPSFEVPLGFAGGLADDATGLVRFGFRDYEPATGRWTARDPLLFDGGQPNLYAYVSNDPVNYVDPTGLIPKSLAAAVEAIALLLELHGDPKDTSTVGDPPKPYEQIRRENSELKNPPGGKDPRGRQPLPPQDNLRLRNAKEHSERFARSAPQRSRKGQQLLQRGRAIRRQFLH